MCRSIIVSTCPKPDDQEGPDAPTRDDTCRFFTIPGILFVIMWLLQRLKVCVQIRGIARQFPTAQTQFRVGIDGTSYKRHGNLRKCMLAERVKGVSPGSAFLTMSRYGKVNVLSRGKD